MQETAGKYWGFFCYFLEMLRESLQILICENENFCIKWHFNLKYKRKSSRHKQILIFIESEITILLREKIIIDQTSQI